MRNFKTISIAFGVLFAVTNALANDIVNYQIVPVVKVDPIGSMRAISMPRMSCTNVEPVEGAGAPVQPQQQKCVSYSDREFRYNVTAFNVTFEYQGQIRTVKMNYDPGNAIRIKTVTKVYAVE
jgi:uncharacterized protein YcfJ